MPRPRREIDTRWGSNGRACKNLLEQLHVTNSNGFFGLCCSKSWHCTMYYDWNTYRTDQWVSNHVHDGDPANQLRSTVLMRRDFFEVQHARHAAPGELKYQQIRCENAKALIFAFRSSRFMLVVRKGRSDVKISWDVQAFKLVQVSPRWGQRRCGISTYLFAIWLRLRKNNLWRRSKRRLMKWQKCRKTFFHLHLCFFLISSTPTIWSWLAQGYFADLQKWWFWLGRDYVHFWLRWMQFLPDKWEFDMEFSWKR